MSAYLIKTDDTYSNLTRVFVDGSSAWVLNRFGVVNQISVSDGSLIKTIDFDLTDSRCIFSDGTYLWVTERGLENYYYGYVVQYEITSAATQNFSYNKFPTSIVSDGNYAWFISPIQNTVTKINVSTGSLNDVAGSFSNPICITYDEQNIYVSNRESSFITVVSKTNDASFSQISTTYDGNPYTGNCIVNDGSNVFYGVYNGYSVNQILRLPLSDLSINPITLSNTFSNYSLASFNNTNLFAYSHSSVNPDNNTLINKINPLTDAIDFSYSFSIQGDFNNYLTNTIITIMNIINLNF